MVRRSNGRVHFAVVTPGDNRRRHEHCAGFWDLDELRQGVELWMSWSIKSQTRTRGNSSTSSWLREMPQDTFARKGSHQAPFSDDDRHGAMTFILRSGSFDVVVDIPLSIRSKGICSPPATVSHRTSSLSRCPKPGAAAGGDGIRSFRLIGAEQLAFFGNRADHIQASPIGPFSTLTENEVPRPRSDVTTLLVHGRGASITRTSPLSPFPLSEGSEWRCRGHPKSQIR